MNNLNIGLTYFGLDETLKEVINCLVSATRAKTKRNKDELIYKALGEVKALYNVLEVTENKCNTEEES